MPLYAFESREGQIQEVFYTMKEAPKLGAVVEIGGAPWRRIPTPSQLATAGLKPIDPHDKKAFINKTGQMAGTLGQAWDYSKEQSEKRAAKDGVDPIKQRYLADYSKKRKGKPNMTALRENQQKVMKEASEKMKKLGISISVA